LSYSEILLLLLTLLSNVIAFVALYRSKRVADRQLAFEAKQAELAAYTLDRNKEAEIKRQQGAISVSVSLRSRGLYNVNLRNVGDVPVSNVQLEIEGRDTHCSPMMSGEEKKLPFERIDPGLTRSVAIVTHLQCYFPFNVSVSWKDPNGADRSLETVLDSA
jgi:hypothetical protein